MTRIIGKMPRRNRTATSSARHPRNRTSHKALDKVAADPRVVLVYDEGPDGVWVDFAEGYNHEGCSSVHGSVDYPGADPVKDVIEQMEMVEKGDPY